MGGTAFVRTPSAQTLIKLARHNLVSSIQRAGAAKRCKVLHRSEEETQMKHVGLPRHQIEIILPAAAV
jgi:hypothetical protein